MLFYFLAKSVFTKYQSSQKQGFFQVWSCTAQKFFSDLWADIVVYIWHILSLSLRAMPSGAFHFSCACCIDEPALFDSVQCSVLLWIHQTDYTVLSTVWLSNKHLSIVQSSIKHSSAVQFMYYIARHSKTKK